MSTEHRVSLCRVGHDQVVRIPREFEFPCSVVAMYKEGERLVIRPIKKRSLLSLLSRWEPLDQPFPDVNEELPALDEPEL